MKISFPLVFLGAVLAPSIGAPQDALDIMWRDWKMENQKIYSSPIEDMARRLIWEENLDFILTHNNRVDVSYKLKMNTFSDMKFPLDGKEKSLCKVTQKEKIENNVLADITAAPKSFDWRTKGVISPVRNQGQMGSAGAIAAEECVESYTAIKTGKLSIMSAEEISDCCKLPLGGPLVDDIFNCVHNIGGLCSNTTYNMTGGQCNNNTCSPIGQVQGNKNVPMGREDLMVTAVLQVPIMVCIDASRPSFAMYTSGIYEDQTCSKTRLDHAVQIVGYGEMNGKQYWICKNSWGPVWGLKGYILIARGTNECGIASDAKYPF